MSGGGGARPTTRRWFLAALAAATGLPAAGCGLRVGRRHAAALSSLVGSSSGAAAVGRAYLDGRGELTAVELARQIHDGLGPMARFDPPEELAARVKGRIAHEIESGSFETVAGWSLPPTEARLAALAALAAD